MHRTILRGAALAAATVALCLGTVATHAQYPDRSIRIVNIGPAGGTADIIARLIGDKLSASLGKPVVAEPVPGAGGSLAAAQVARAAPDGYTLFLSGDA